MSVGSWQRWFVISTGVLLPSLVSVPAKGVLEVSLEYSVPSGIGCPSEAEFRAAVAERLEEDPFVAAAARTVAVEISATDGRLNGVVRWTDREGILEGQRRFEAAAADCSDLARNMVFAVTVQLQLLELPEDASPPASSPGTESDARGEAARAPTPTPTPTRTPTPAPTVDPSVPARAWNFDMGAGIGAFLVSGWTPDVAPGGRVLVLGRVPRFSLHVAFEASLPQRHSTSDAAGFESSVLAASVAPCWRSPVVEACPVLRFGQVRTRGFGVDEPKSPRGTLWEFGLRVGAGGALWASLEGKAYLELLYAPSPWTVQLNERSVFVAPSFVFLGGIDLVAFFL